MYFIAYLVGEFYSHLHLSFLNINTNIHMKGECTTVPSLFCKINVLNIFFLLLLQYSWSGILNLIKIIHVPQSITMRVTHPCVMCFGLAYCVPFKKKHNHFGNFICIKKIKWQYVACTCTIILANVQFGVCLLDFLVFDIPKTNVYVYKCWTDAQKARV